jgi:hypothetical protein
MNPLRRLENALAGLVEGTFGRVFRSEVRPMELAHKLAREMDEHATASVSRVYAPNEYSVWLSPRDRERYEGVEEEVIEELCAYLLEHARAEDFALASAPQIGFHTDERLRLGEFGIEARMARHLDAEQSVSPRPRARGADLGAPSLPQPAPPPPRPAIPRPAPPVEEPAEEGSRTMIYSNAERVRGAVARAGGGRRTKALLVVDGRRLIVPPRGAVVGRSRDCDVVLEDSSVSRRHAELRPDGDRWTLQDLESTNGVRVNGRTVRGAQALSSGDRIELGSAEVVFEVAP